MARQPKDNPVDEQADSNPGSSLNSFDRFVVSRPGQTIGGGIIGAIPLFGSAYNLGAAKNVGNSRLGQEAPIIGNLAGGMSAVGTVANAVGTFLVGTSLMGGPPLGIGLSLLGVSAVTGAYSSYVASA